MKLYAWWQTLFSLFTMPVQSLTNNSLESRTDFNVSPCFVGHLRRLRPHPGAAREEKRKITDTA